MDKLQRFDIEVTSLAPTSVRQIPVEGGEWVRSTDAKELEGRAERLERRNAELEESLKRIDDLLVKAEVPCFCHDDQECFLCITKKARGGK